MLTDAQIHAETCRFPPSERPRCSHRWWHTALLIVVLLAASLGGTREPPSPGAVMASCRNISGGMAWEWMLLGFIWLGIRKRITLRDADRRPLGAAGRLLSRHVSTPLSSGSARWWCWAACAKLMHLDQAGKIEAMRKQLGFLTPGSRLELAVWFCVSATAGFCEEIIFRGYLQRQFAVTQPSMLAGVLLSAVVFGASHGYEGGRAHAADRNLWINVWITRVVAKEPSSGNDRARVARRIQRRNFANAEIASVHAAFTHVRS